MGRPPGRRPPRPRQFHGRRPARPAGKRRGAQPPEADRIQLVPVSRRARRHGPLGRARRPVVIPIAPGPGRVAVGRRRAAEDHVRSCYLRLLPSPPQIAPSSVTVPLVELRDDLPPPQMAPEPATEGLSTTDLAPPVPPQMAPLPEVIDD